VGPLITRTPIKGIHDGSILTRAWKFLKFDYLVFAAPETTLPLARGGTNASNVVTLNETIKRWWEEREHGETVKSKHHESNLTNPQTLP
jgi:hypothetical protein